MRRFLITNPEKFTGTAEIFYNRDNVLCWMDCKATNMNSETVQAFKNSIPSSIEKLVEGKSFSGDTTIVEAGYRVPFLDWWKLYDKKINKARCIPEYERLNDSDTVINMDKTMEYNRFLSKVKIRQKLDPENWLKSRGWENEWK